MLAGKAPRAEGAACRCVHVGTGSPDTQRIVLDCEVSGAPDAALKRSTTLHFGSGSPAAES